MILQPDLPLADRVDPQSPPEHPGSPTPEERPIEEPVETPFDDPAIEEPNPVLPETPPPPD